MTPHLLSELLERLARGELSVARAVEEIRHLPFAEVEGARVDHHRELRTGLPEVVFGEGKSSRQLIDIATELIARSGGVLVTRLDADKAADLGHALNSIEYFPDARLAMRRRPQPPRRGVDAGGSLARIAVVSAGTSDQGVAEEAALTLEFMGIAVSRHRDVGVAGVHRLLADREQISAAAVTIVVAGMEGALPSVVGGLVDVPVIAVPTSVGYGASFGGLAALLAMMNSCAPGVTVVNIDNGFGAAVAAAAVLRSAARLAAR
ncbi:MAG: nickel pincer cofactor biosynthesis protein LarB [Deltaproteobacteria bacterium]|nr:nickel pincer cofactor biosynthesis protein LarB [Deltaproteobacteria bacterium]